MSDKENDVFEVAVHGRRFDNRATPDVAQAYVLDERITGHDSYRPARLVRPDGPEVTVRVLTLDDITLIYPLSDQIRLPDEWDGRLLLTAKPRGPKLPADLAAALVAAGVDVDELDPARRRHLIGFVAEAKPGPTREARIAAAVQAARQDHG
jgi:hypothetical protein